MECQDISKSVPQLCDLVILSHLSVRSDKLLQRSKNIIKFEGGNDPSRVANNRKYNFRMMQPTKLKKLTKSVGFQMTGKEDKDHVKMTEHDLPQVFILKFLGWEEAKGLWGIKHTRQPVDKMVNTAKSKELALPFVQLKVTKEGVFISPLHCRSAAVQQLQQHKDSANLSHRCAEQVPPSELQLMRKQNNGKNGNFVQNDLLGTLKMSWLEMRTSFQSSRKGRNLKNVTCEVTSDVTRMEPTEKVKLVEEKNLSLCKEKSQTDKTDGTTKTEGQQGQQGQQGPPSTDLILLDRFKRHNWQATGSCFFGIDSISYGVQDLVFTRVFSMIVVSEQNQDCHVPFTCHAFVCESRSTARKLTYCLAAAFQVRQLRFQKNSKKSKKLTQFFFLLYELLMFAPRRWGFLLVFEQASPEIHPCIFAQYLTNLKSHEQS